MAKSSLAGSALLAIGLLACTGTDDGRELALDERDGFAAGEIEVDAETVSFEVVQLGDQAFELSYELHGMTVTYLIDRAAGVIEMDGFTSTSGEDTQFTADDRAAMHALARALDTVTDASELVRLARRVASGLADTPDSFVLRQQIFAEADRSYTSICWAVNSWQSASHDCWDYDWWEDRSTLDYAYVSMHGAGSCNDGTYFWNGSWQCYEPDHSSTIEEAYGNCLGRCGAGCGSDTQFTWDCLDHDQCVRTGHDLASFWCDDQFTSTLDDWAAAPDC